MFHPLPSSVSLSWYFAIARNRTSKRSSTSLFLWMISINFAANMPFPNWIQFRRGLEAEWMATRMSKWSSEKGPVLFSIHFSPRVGKKILCPGSYKAWMRIFRHNAQNETLQTPLPTLYQDKVYPPLLQNWLICPHCAFIIKNNRWSLRRSHLGSCLTESGV